MKWHQIKSLFSFMRNAARYGATLSSKSCQSERLAICASCPKVVAGRKGLACGVCGCHLHNRVAPTASVCPIGKWGAGDKISYKQTLMFLLSSLRSYFSK